MKSFDVPIHYRSPLINAIKNERKAADKMKKDYTPTLLDLGSVRILLARHFGFCYGVEHAIEIAFRAISENSGKRIFLLSEMIHNPQVNADLQDEGIRFIMDTKGNQLIPWQNLNQEDIVIVPAFGTTLEIEKRLKDIGIEPTRYNTTCPFVEKVWNRSEKIGKEGYTIIVHGKPQHEETRATFSHSEINTPTLVIRDIEQARTLAKYITAEKPAEAFENDFNGQHSPAFDPVKDLQRIGVVNQTTMLASETQEISDYLKAVITQHYHLNAGNIKTHFADTRDTLCYATNDNQTAVSAMLDNEADLALVIGGYNSSNTSHLVELCSQTLPTYFIKNENCLIDAREISHFDLNTHTELISTDYLPTENDHPIRIMVTSGASCPDAQVERVIERIAALTGNGDKLTLLKEQCYQS